MSLLFFGLGILVGVLAISLFWIAYLAFFPDEARAMGDKVRRWFKRKTRN